VKLHNNLHLVWNFDLNVIPISTKNHVQSKIFKIYSKPKKQFIM